MAPSEIMSPAFSAVALVLAEIDDAALDTAAPALSISAPTFALATATFSFDLSMALSSFWPTVLPESVCRSQATRATVPTIATIAIGKTKNVDLKLFKIRSSHDCVGYCGGGVINESSA